MTIINSGISIRNLFILSMTVVVVAMTLGTIFIADIDLEYLASTNIATSRKAVNNVIENNYSLSEKVLTSYGKDLVELKAKGVAAQLSLVFREMDITNYSAIRLNESIRELATQPIFINDREVGYLDLLDNTGQAVLHPNKDVEGRNFYQWADKYPLMWKYVKQSFTKEVVRGFYDFIDLEGNTRKKYMTLVQVQGTQFITVAAVNFDEFFLPVQQLIRENGEKTAVEAEQKLTVSVNEASDQIRNHTIIGGVALLVFCVLLSLRMAVILTDPIMKLRKGVLAVGQGELDTKLEEKGPSEIVELARGFNMMEARLNEYINRIRHETAVRQAMESEISIAANIQESLLPNSFPPFPDRNEFSLYGINIAAREVGGDFYDFFFIDDHNLAFIIGDVSGKGIPAALFMAITRTLFRIICLDEVDPSKAMERVNRTLCQDNDACMFVTVFLGYYDINTGCLKYANAGHPDAILCNGPESCVETEHPESIVLGIEPDASFLTVETVINPGTSIFLYTDGVTEACMKNSVFFGEDRLKRYLKKVANDLSVEEVCGMLADQLDKFQAGNQFDDITMLFLRREV